MTPLLPVAIETEDKTWDSNLPSTPRFDEGRHHLITSILNKFDDQRLLTRLRVVMFDQFDALAVPGGGLRHLDFPTDVQSLFEDMLVPPSGQVNEQVGNVEAVPNLQPHTTPRVRVYGSEQDM